MIHPKNFRDDRSTSIILGICQPKAKTLYDFKMESSKRPVVVVVVVPLCVVNVDDLISFYRSSVVSLGHWNWTPSWSVLERSDKKTR